MPSYIHEPGGEGEGGARCARRTPRYAKGSRGAHWSARVWISLDPAWCRGKGLTVYGFAVRFSAPNTGANEPMVACIQGPGPVDPDERRCRDISPVAMALWKVEHVHALPCCAPLGVCLRL